VGLEIRVSHYFQVLERKDETAKGQESRGLGKGFQTSGEEDMIWLTADEHYGHRNILEYCDRPWKDIKIHDDKISQQVQLLVGPYDTVFHLGDTFFRKNEPLDFIFPGHHVYLQGSHDSLSLTKHIKSVVIQYGGLDINLVHDPRDARQEFPLNLCGHVHGAWLVHEEGKTILINVGVDVWDFKPVQITTLIKLYRKEVGHGK
jgi:calcineurin-like phosphoesterase family protein